MKSCLYKRDLAYNLSTKMASTLCRAIAGFTRRVVTSPAVSSARYSGGYGGPTDPDYNFKGKVGT